MIQATKGFKPGTTEFDKMQGRINRLDNEVELYKKIILKNERDQKKLALDWDKEREQLHNNEVNLLAELRTIKEQHENTFKVQQEQLLEAIELRQEASHRRD